MAALHPVPTVEPDQLLLDPNNYRFLDLSSYKPVLDRARYGEPNIQARTMNLLQSTKKFQLEPLKDSILTNGYVPLEQIVVEEFDQVDGKKRYLVIEGNRRIAAVKSLLDELEHGHTVMSDEVLESLGELRACELRGEADERRLLKQTLMAIRHVAGVEEWGPYQQATLIAELYEQQPRDRRFGTVAQRIGMTAPEVGRRYRAIKMLKQMENDEEHSEYAVPEMYALFHEAVSLPIVRNWLGFSDRSFQAEAETRRDFYELLIPGSVNGKRIPPKIGNVRQVRRLKGIVDKPGPLSILLDPDRPFEDAVEAAESEMIEESSGILERSIARAIRSLNQPSLDAWSNPSKCVQKLWKRLVGTVSKIELLMREL